MMDVVSAPGSAVLVVNASGELGGAERVVLRLIARARADGRPVTVASPTGPLVAELPAGVEHVELPTFGMEAARGGRRLVAAARWLARTPATRRALRTVAAAGVEAVVVNSLLALPAVRVARLGVPVVWLAHDVIVDRRQRLFSRLARPWRTIAVSATTAAPLRALGLGVEVAVNGVELGEFVPLSQRPPAPRPTVGLLGLVTAWKGADVLLEAVAAVPEVDVEIAGPALDQDREFVERLHRRAEHADLVGRVRFVGPVDAATTLRSWSLMVSASVRPEAGPLTVPEAMAAGTPVIATAHGAPVELLAEGRGLLVAPGDPVALAAAIRGVVTTPPDDAALAAARAYVAAHFDLDHTLDRQYHAVFGTGSRR